MILLYEESFTDQTVLVLNHNLDRIDVSVRVVQEDGVRDGQVIQEANFNPADPRNSIIITLTSSLTGRALVVDTESTSILPVTVLQDFDTLLDVDASTTAVAPNWGDLLVVPLVVTGTGNHDVKISATLTGNGAGAAGAILRVVLRDGGTDTPIGIPGRLTSGGGQPIGNSAMNGRLENVAAGNYDVVVQGRVTTGTITVNASTNPAIQGLNINIQEIFNTG